MAEFDPALQNLNDPSYTRDSRGAAPDRTPGPEGVAQGQIIQKGVETPDRSGEYLGKAAGTALEASGANKKGLGDLFAGVVGIGDFFFKGADALIKKDIERQVYDVANKEREEYTARLEGLLNKTGKKSIFDANAQMTETMPGELEDLPDSLSQLKAGVDAGKISNTYYTGRLLSQAKDLRARYPQYREYIDQQFAQVTGMNPANARITALTQDINRAMTSQATEVRRMEAEVMKRNGWASNGVNSVQAIQKIRTGEWTSMADVAAWAYPNDKLEADTKMKENAWKSDKVDNERRTASAHEAALGTLAKESHTMLNNLMAQFEVKDPDELLLKLKENKDPKWWQDRAAELRWTANQYDAKMFAAFNHKEPGDKYSLAQAMNLKPSEIKAYIKEYGSNELRDLATSLEKQDANGVAGLAFRNKARVDEAVEFFTTHPDIKEFALGGAAGKQLFGDNDMIAREFTDRILKQRFSGRWKTALDAHAIKLRTGAAVGQPTSFNEVIDKLQANKILTKPDVNKYVNIVTDITNPKVTDEEKYGIIESAFGERNRGFVGKIAEKYQDADGRRIQGPWGVFERWTTPEIAKEVKRLDGKYKGVWAKYVSWAEHTMVNDLLPQDIQVLNHMDRDLNFDVKWETSKNGVRELRLIPGKQPDDGTNLTIQRQISGGTLPREKELNAVVARFNSALSKYSNIASESGMDADAFILRSLHNGNLLNKGIFSDKLLSSMKNSRIKQEVDKNAGR